MTGKKIEEEEEKKRRKIASNLIVKC